MVTIEPIKNQYLTALKERQQIIDKLNEIISGLNALDFDDLTTIHAELVAIRESLQTQNTAITEINNSIGQIETELTSFDNRLITLNTNIENTESNLTSFENDTALNLQSKVNKNGDTMTGNLGIPTTTTGVRDSFAVNGTRLQNDLDNYEPMVRTTGNYTIYGEMIINRMICGNLIPNKKQTAPYGYGTNGENWHKTYTGKLASYSRGGTLIVYDVNNFKFGVFVILGYSGLIRADRVIGDFPLERIKLCKGSTESDTDFAIYFNTSTQNNRLWVYVDSDFSSLNANTPYPSTSIFTPLVPTIPENDPSTTGVWTTIVTGVE